MRIGSLCSGAGGLDMAVERVLGATTAWHCELEKLPEKDGSYRHNAAVDVLAARWPGVPNHGDLTSVDWDTVEPVDVLTGGYPCQPFSHAGKRKGTDDERHIWPGVREAIRRLRPRITFLENVAGHRSLGFDRVLGDLAEDGLHARWVSLRAADVGSCHARERLWIIVTDPTRDGRDEWRDQSAGLVGRPDAAIGGPAYVALLPTPAASRSGRNQSPSPGAAIRPSLDMITDLLPTPAARDGKGHNPNREGGYDLPGALALLPTPAAADSHRGPDLARANRAGSGGDDLHTFVYKTDRDGQWGKYAPAIHRWEQLTRPVPSPTEPNAKGNPRLHAPFPEWMMGWPAGWVTDVPGISRNDQLRIIGAGVVPQCAEAALSWLLNLELAA